jgi:hypothetical protein
LEEELGVLSEIYLKGTTKEMLLIMVVTMGVSNSNDNMEGSLDNEGVNIAY